jgi:hypothetical protein
MIKKPFVSISFSHNKLQLLKLSSSKKKVEKFATIDLPDRLIVGQRVQDTKVLGNVLGSLWKKLKVKERSVGIVVPEFSTFIKNLKIPKIEAEDIDEAVRWQAQEFLPRAIKNMSMDWRIIKRFDEEYQVLAVALEKEVLNGYVEAADMAGLFPLVVETPSISLVRVSNSDELGKLIIYRYFDEVILIVAEGEKILGSGVVGPKNTNEIVNTARRIVNHYKETKIEKVLIGGIDVSDDLVSSLHKTFNLQLNRLSVGVSGMSAEDIQKYLIPISLQYKLPSEPSDENTINLLPTTLLSKYDSKRLRVRVWSLLMFVTFIVWSSFFITLGTFIFLNQQASNLKTLNGSKLNTIIETEEARGKISGINKTSEKVIGITKATDLPHVIINPLYRIKPEGVTIKTYNIDLDLGSVVISGKSATRTDLINFKKSIEGLEDFVQVSLPISSFEVESNLDYELSFVYLPDSKLVE